MNLTPLGWIDVHDLACSLRPRLPQFQGTGTRLLPLRGPRKDAADGDGELADSRLLGKWPELQAVLAKLDAAAAHRVGPVEYGRITLEMLDPGSFRVRRPAVGGGVLLLLAIRSNPGAYLIAPPEQVIMHPGQVVMALPSLWMCAVNLGESPRINLIIEVSTPSPPRSHEPEAPEDPSEA